MKTSFRLRISLVSVLLLIPAFWLVGDALYAHRTLARANAPDARRASAEAFALNPGGTPALLLIHGFADGPSVFVKIASILAKSGFAVRAMHLRGSGIPPAEMAGTTLQTWRDDIDREIAGLRADAADRPVWLVGHSLGGALAFDAALRPTNQIAGLVLLAPLIEPSDVRSPLLSSRRWFALLDHALVFSDIVESRLPADLHDPEARARYKTDRFIHRDIYRALFDAIDAIRPRAADWRGPLLMVVSPSDQIVDTDAATRFFFAATNARPAGLSERFSGGHVLPLDTGFPQIAAKISRFVHEASAPAPR
jgi:alpha-beta hydrolase superfamily lysophospholipase